MERCALLAGLRRVQLQCFHPFPGFLGQFFTPFPNVRRQLFAQIPRCISHCDEPFFERWCGLTPVSWRVNFSDAA